MGCTYCHVKKFVRLPLTPGPPRRGLRNGHRLHYSSSSRMPEKQARGPHLCAWPTTKGEAKLLLFAPQRRRFLACTWISNVASSVKAAFRALRTTAGKTLRSPDLVCGELFEQLRREHGLTFRIEAGAISTITVESSVRSKECIMLFVTG